MSEEVVITKCPCCGASMKKHWHRLSTGLVTVLIKFRAAVINKGMNNIHVPKDVNFTKTEYNNFQKLRYHGLVAKVKDKSGQHAGGHWLLTRRGNLFCKNQVSIPVKVQTFRNKISAKSTEITDIYTVLEIAADATPYWDTAYDFTYELADMIDIPDHETLLTDEKGNGLLFTK